MEVKVTKNKVLIVNNDYTVNQGEYHANACNFIFSEEYTSDLVKKAVFSQNGTNIEMVIVHNGCDIPAEFLNGDAIKLGVYAYEVRNDNLILRYSPTPTNIYLRAGSYTGITGSGEEITPTQFEQYEQALHDGLNELDEAINDMDNVVETKMIEVDDKLEVVDNKIEIIDSKIEESDEAIEKANTVAETLETKLENGELNGATFIPSVSSNGDISWTNDKGLVNPVTRNIRGPQGIPGPQGEAFTIKKTYSSVAEMNADFNNMQLGDYVMIASDVEIEDNAKLYTRGQSAWIFITDFSGATGIQGPQGIPGIQGIPGPSGPRGETGATGATGNGIASIAKTGTSGLVDTYTITYTNGDTTTYNVTNGEDGEVSQAELDEVTSDLDYWKTTYNSMAKVTGNGTSITLDDTGNSPMEMELSPSELSQATTTGKNLCTSVTGAGTTDLRFAFNRNYFDKTFTLSFTSNEALNGNSIYLDKSVGGTVALGTISGSANSRVSVTATIPDSAYTDLLSSTWWNLRVYKGGASFNEPNDAMIETGSSLSPYEPYTGAIASPNPSYPQDIHVVSGDNTVFVDSANIFDQESLRSKTFLESTYKYTTAGIVGGRELYFKARLKSGKSAISGLYVCISTVGTNPNQGVNIFSIRGGVVATMEISNVFPNTNLYFAFYPTTHTIEDILDRYDFWVSIADNEYVEYQPEQTFPLTLGNLEYCKIGDYEDEFVIPSGKNKFNMNTTVYTRNALSSYSFSNGVYTLIPTGTGNPNITLDVSIPAGTYILNSKKYLSVASVLTTKNGAILKNFGSNYTNISFTITEESALFSFNWANPENTNPIILDLTSLIISEEGGDYEPYNDGKWYLKKNVANNVYVGSENDWFKSGITSGDRYMIDIPAIYQDLAPIICNYFRAGNENIFELNTVKILTVYGTNTVRLAVDFAEYNTTDLTTFKSWLSTHNTEAYYPLATPQYTLLNDTLQTQLNAIYKKVLSYQDQTNISQTNDDLPFVIKASACRLPITKTSELTNDSNFVSDSSYVHTDNNYTTAEKTQLAGLTNVAKTNTNNNFSTNQTINGNLQVNGNITNIGSSYETHAEKVYSKNDYIITRDGAVSGLASGSYTGFQAKLYDGTNDGRLVFDNTGTARVGDVGDEVPLLARDESSNMSSGYVMTWDSTNLIAKTTFAVVTLTQAQYDALQTKDANTYYMIEED